MWYQETERVYSFSLGAHMDTGPKAHAGRATVTTFDTPGHPKATGFSDPESRSPGQKTAKRGLRCLLSVR